MTARSREAFLAAAEAAVAAVGREDVAAAWNEPSALEGWTVGGLAGHLTRAVATVQRYLDADADVGDGPVLDAPGYVLAALSDDDLDVGSALAQAIRARGDDEAAIGPAALHRQTAAVLEALRPRLDDVPGDTTLAVLDSLRLAFDDYLATRVVELVVHLDDLAASTGVDVSIPQPALAMATDVLVEVARRRRGDLAVLHVLARRERADDAPLAL